MTRFSSHTTVGVLITPTAIVFLMVLILLPFSARGESGFYINISVEDFGHSQYDTVQVIMEEGSLYFGEFDFLIWYDSRIMELTNVFGGEELYSKDNGCGWKDLTFKDASELYANNDSGTVVRINGGIGASQELEDDQCLLPLEFPATLVNLEFKLNYNLFGQHYPTTSPVNFYWSNCSDNTLLSPSGETVYVVDSIAGVYHRIEYHRTAIPAVKPQFTNDCFKKLEKLQNVIRNIFFRHGYIHFGFCYYIDTRGDLNLNEITSEPSDYSMFRDYLLKGSSVFHINPDGQMAAADLNYDGSILTLEDFVSLGRNIVGDTIPYSFELADCKDTAYLKVSYSKLILNFNSSDSLGALLLTFSGDFTPVIDYFQLMELDYHTANDTTRVLIHRLAGGRAVQQGTVIAGVRGQLISTQAATYHGAKVKCVIESPLPATD